MGARLVLFEGVVEVCLKANGRFVAEDIEGLDAGGAEIGVEVTGAIPGVAADAWRARLADLEGISSAAGGSWSRLDRRYWSRSFVLRQSMRWDEWGAMVAALETRETEAHR